MKLLYGNRPEELIKILNKRKKTAYEPGKSKDGFKLALVIEGGGMRGVISSSATDALDQLGYRNCFDNIYGTSAGAINGAYLLSGNISQGTSIYYDSLTNKHFVDLFSWPDIMNIHYLFDEWLLKGKPLDIKKIIESPTLLYITTTNVRTGIVKYFINKYCDQNSLIASLRASSSTPMFSTNQEKIGDEYFNDGAVTSAIPIKKAIEDECTHAVCLLTREHEYRKKQSLLLKIFENIRLRNYSNEYKSVYHNRIDDYNEALEIIYEKKIIPTLVITPQKNDLIVGNGEINSEKLTKAARDALLRVAKIFDVNPEKLHLYIDLEK